MQQIHFSLAAHAGSKKFTTTSIPMGFPGKTSRIAKAATANDKCEIKKVAFMKSVRNHLDWTGYRASTHRPGGFGIFFVQCFTAGCSFYLFLKCFQWWRKISFSNRQGVFKWPFRRFTHRKFINDENFINKILSQIIFYWLFHLYMFLDIVPVGDWNLSVTSVELVTAQKNFRGLNPGGCTGAALVVTLKDAS